MESCVAGPTDIPLLDRTVGAVLEAAAERWGDRDALIACAQGRRMTYAQLDESATRLAAGLLRLGLEPGDRVGIWAPNCFEWVVTQFATAKAGLILVNINPAHQLSELKYALTKTACRALVLAPRCRTSDYVEMIRTLLPELPALHSLILIDAESRPEFLSYADVERSGRAEDFALLRRIGQRLRPGDPINIQFTSGTTGQPKGATLTHRNIVNDAYFTARQMRFTERDRRIPVPLYHCFGMVMGVLGCVTHVFGVPDDRFGEVVCAWIRLGAGAQASESEIRAYCRGQIAHFKVPQHIRFVDEFPMTVTGKIQKFIMRERMREQLGARQAVTA